MFLPIFFTRVVGFSLQQWLQILSIMFATNVVLPPVGICRGPHRLATNHHLRGIMRLRVDDAGALLRAPHLRAELFPGALASMAYGAALAGFVPIGAIMATLAPESRGAAMSIMNLRSGMSTSIGPAIAGIFLPLLGVGGVIWIFAGMYGIAAVISFNLHIPGERDASG